MRLNTDIYPYCVRDHDSKDRRIVTKVRVLQTCTYQVSEELTGKFSWSCTCRSWSNKHYDTEEEAYKRWRQHTGITRQDERYTA